MMKILYGTQTGNAKYLAEEVGRECTRRHIMAKVSAMDDYDITQLPTEKIIVFIVATTGQGEPTATMKKSWKFLTRKDLPSDSLSNLNFTVFGLGDSSYEIFNAMARKLYQRLTQLGATWFHERALGDDQHDFGYEAEFDPWLNALWDNLFKLDPSLKHDDILPEDSLEACVYHVKLITVQDREDLLTPEEKEFLSQNTDENGILNTMKYYNDPVDVKSGKLFGTMGVNKVITSDGVKESEDKETLHIELEFADQALSYNPGDVWCVIPRNNGKLIEEFLESQDLKSDDLLRISSNKEAVSSNVPSTFPPLISAAELFECWLDTLGVPNRYFFKAMARFTEDETRGEKLLLLSSKTSEGKNEYYRYCHREKRTHVEILHDFNTTKIPLNYLIQLIGAQKPREFSISCSQLVNPSSIHLTMGVLRYKTIGFKRLKEGICSSYLAALQESDSRQVLCYIKAGTFHIPTDLSVPIICVAAGTGVAPFRSIIQDRIARIKHEEAKVETPNLVLFYGCRNDKDDDYYAEEWEEMAAYLKVVKAYSRVTDSKIYVQHKIKENAELWQQLLVEQKGSVFIAGQSKFMPKSVLKAFIEVLNLKEGVDGEQYIKLMKKSGRYIVEAW
jgi:sulfite reductase alpha subunit-like flavoprotein